MVSNYWICIPARLRSSRLPEKALADLAGQPMVVRVAQAAARTRASRILVATDDRAIESAVKAAGFECLMTRADHATGTDRLAEVVQQTRAEPHQVLVNLQGDEPLMPQAPLDQVAIALDADPLASVSTAVTAIEDQATLQNPNVVKAVIGLAGQALYFSRAPIPYQRDGSAVPEPGVPLGWRHLGLYAYRAAALEAFAHWSPSPAETREQLEQLRWLHQGHRITCVELASAPPPGVDTAEDLEVVRRAFGCRASSL